MFMPKTPIPDNLYVLIIRILMLDIANKASFFSTKPLKILSCQPAEALWRAVELYWDDVFLCYVANAGAGVADPTPVLVGAD